MFFRILSTVPALVFAPFALGGWRPIAAGPPNRFGLAFLFIAFRGSRAWPSVTGGYSGFEPAGRRKRSPGAALIDGMANPFVDRSSGDAHYR